MDYFNFPIDHFGVVMSPQLIAMLKQDSNNRARKVAFNSIVKVAKASKQIPANSKVERIGVSCNAGGQMAITFLIQEESLEDPNRP